MRSSRLLKHTALLFGVLRLSAGVSVGVRVCLCTGDTFRHTVTLAASARLTSPSSRSQCLHCREFRVYKRVCDFILVLLMHISLKYSISNMIELYKCYHALHIILQLAFSL